MVVLVLSPDIIWVFVQNQLGLSEHFLVKNWCQSNCYCIFNYKCSDILSWIHTVVICYLSDWVQKIVGFNCYLIGFKAFNDLAVGLPVLVEIFYLLCHWLFEKPFVSWSNKGICQVCQGINRSGRHSNLLGLTKSWKCALTDFQD